jgi:hypothetical protein
MHNKTKVGKAERRSQAEAQSSHVIAIDAFSLNG